MSSTTTAPASNRRPGDCTRGVRDVLRSTGALGAAVSFRDCKGTAMSRKVRPAWANARKIRSKVRDQLARATRQKNDSRRTVASEATAASIASLTYIRAHDPEARRVRLDLGADRIARITTQRHGAAMLLVLPDTVGIYERGCAADQIAADVAVHRKRGAA